MKIFEKNGLWCLQAEANDLMWRYGSSREILLIAELHEWMISAFSDQWTIYPHGRHPLLVSRSKNVILVFKLRWQGQPEASQRDAAAFYAPYIPLTLTSSTNAQNPPRVPALTKRI